MMHSVQYQSLNCYALLADSTRDKSNAKTLAIKARFVNSDEELQNVVFMPNACRRCNDNIKDNLWNFT